MSEAFVQIEVRAPDAAQADRLLAEAYASGAVGCEERESEGSGKCLLLYVEADRAEAVGRALRAVAVDSEIGAPEPVSSRDWATAWREGLGALVISPRLVVRPPFVEHPQVPFQQTVLIDPGQAFGTGEHESTRLALELLDAWIPKLGHQPQVLDVGTGSGVLALAAVKLGARRAVGFDIDPVATAAAKENVRQNGELDRVEIETGGIEVLAADGFDELSQARQGRQFDAVVANLLRREILPILKQVSACIVPDGVGIFTGLLVEDRSALAEGLTQLGFEIIDETRRDDSRGERWIGLVARTASA